MHLRKLELKIERSGLLHRFHAENRALQSQNYLWWFPRIGRRSYELRDLLVQGLRAISHFSLRIQFVTFGPRSTWMKATCWVRLFDMTVNFNLPGLSRKFYFNEYEERSHFLLRDELDPATAISTNGYLFAIYAVIDWWWNPAYQSFAECLSVDIVFPSSEWTLLHEISRKEFCAIPSGSSGSALN